MFTGMASLLRAGKSNLLRDRGLVLLVIEAEPLALDVFSQVVPLGLGLGGRSRWERSSIGFRVLKSA